MCNKNLLKYGPRQHTVEQWAPPLSYKG